MKRLILRGINQVRTVSIMLATAAFGLTAAPAAAVTQFAGNGHLYEFVATDLSWQGALAAAAAATMSEPAAELPVMARPAPDRAEVGFDGRAYALAIASVRLLKS